MLGLRQFTHTTAPCPSCSPTRLPDVSSQRQCVPLRCLAKHQFGRPGYGHRTYTYSGTALGVQQLSPGPCSGQILDLKTYIWKCLFHYRPTHRLPGQFCCGFAGFPQSVQSSSCSSVIPPSGAVQSRRLTFRHRASCILGHAFHYSPENAFYIRGSFRN